MSVVDLPAPFGPSSATHRARGHLEVDAVQHLDASYAARMPAQLEQRHAAGRALDGRSAVAHTQLRSEVGVDAPPRSARTSLGRALGDDRAEVEHRQSVHTRITSGTSCSTSRIAEPRAGQLDQQVAELPGLGVVEARCRLVQQQHARPDGEGPAELDQPGLAGGQLRRRGRRRRAPRPRRSMISSTSSSTRELVAVGGQQLAAGRAAARPAATDLEPTSTLSRAVSDANTSRRWNVRADAEPGPSVGAEAGDVVAVEAHPARRSGAARRRSG